MTAHAEPFLVLVMLAEKNFILINDEDFGSEIDLFMDVGHPAERIILVNKDCWSSLMGWLIDFILKLFLLKPLDIFLEVEHQLEQRLSQTIGVVSLYPYLIIPHLGHPYNHKTTYSRVLPSPD